MHVQAIRDRAAVAMGLPAAVTCLRQVLLPGLAQMWYRAFYLYTESWPWKLLQLLPCTVSARRTTVAQDFLDACPDCLDRGLSLPLREHLTTVHPREQCALVLANNEDETVGAILSQLQSDAEASIMDIECRHARNRRAERGGRPPDFASMAARCFLRECTMIHAQVTGQLPSGHHKARMLQAKQAVALSVPARFKHTVANPFFAFRREREAAWKAAQHGPTSGSGPRSSAWEQQVANDWKDMKENMPEFQLAYTTRAKERKAELAGQPPQKRRRKAGKPVAPTSTLAALADVAAQGHHPIGAASPASVGPTTSAMATVATSQLDDASRPGAVVLREAQSLRSEQRYYFHVFAKKVYCVNSGQFCALSHRFAKSL